jgi:hypothetical protein
LLTATICDTLCLQHNAGRYTGRWSYGHKIWGQYKEIAFDLRHRTREIQYKRGLGNNPNDGSDANFDDKVGAKRFPDDMEESDVDDDNDDGDPALLEKRQVVRMVQPQAEDLHWVQIEDFVDVFNRVYITQDLTLEKDGGSKRFVSKWIPGDFIGGSGGPPIIIATQTDGGATDGAAGNGGDKKGADAAEDEGDGVSRPATAAAPASAPAEPKVVERYAMINDSFTDNPMYPFSVSEPTTMSICLYQKDRRWNMGRLGDNPRDVLVKQYASRGQRLQACMEYPTGIAFAVVKLSGLKHRLTEFRLKKIVSGSECMVFSNIANNLITLRPGRYAIIPYTHTRLSRAAEYVLHCNFPASTVDFEIEDVLEQRLVDDAPSDEDEDEEMQPDDNDLLHLHEDSDDVSIMSFEKVRSSASVCYCPGFTHSILWFSLCNAGEGPQ